MYNKTNDGKQIGVSFMCVFCEMDSKRKIYENQNVYVILDGYPVSQGHSLIITKRHVSNYFELTLEEKQAIDQALMHMKKQLYELYHPAGYNIGINNGDAAGQTVMHLHVHLIPRYKGDMENPRGGVRGVIPEKQKY